MKKGFTLIEILIVIAIIGILAVAFVPSILGAPAKGRDAQRIEMLSKISDFLALKYAEGGALPVTIGDNWDTMCILESEDNDISTFIKDNIASFGGVFPSDPQPSNYAIKEGDTGQCQGGFVYHRPDPSVEPCGLQPDVVFALGAGVELDENTTSEENSLFNDEGGDGGDGCEGDGGPDDDFDPEPFYVLFTGK